MTEEILRVYPTAEKILELVDPLLWDIVHQEVTLLEGYEQAGRTEKFCCLILRKKSLPQGYNPFSKTWGADLDLQFFRK